MKIFFTHERRPWGVFDTLVKDRNCQVKVLQIHPYESISLQRHAKRDQLYYIISPLRIQFGARKENITTVDVAQPGRTFYFPAGMWHRATNLSGDIAFYVEVSFGDYDELDIERADDKYDRHINIPQL